MELETISQKLHMLGELMGAAADGRISGEREICPVALKTFACEISDLGLAVEEHLNTPPMREAA